MKKSPPSSGQWLVLMGLAVGFASAADLAPVPAKPASKTEQKQTPPDITITVGPLCPTFSQPENSTQAKLISKMRLQAEERSAQHQADLATISADKALIDSGDFSPIAKAAAAKDVMRLWLFFDVARTAQFGVNDIRFKHALEDERVLSAQRAFNQQVFDEVRQAIAAIPGHALPLGDLVERLSSDPIAAQLRSSAFRYLGELGSMEAIQQIGRFIDDPRDPAAATREHGPLLPFGLAGRPNYFLACQALQEALGEESPLRDESTGRARRRDGVEGSDFDFLQAWWKSDAAKPYREWRYADGMPLLNPRTAAQTARSSTQATPPP